MTYEELQIKHHDLNIVEMDLSEVNGLKGLYVDRNIAIEKTLTQIEKACVLAEELGHYHTTTGNILDQSKVENRKQELKARLGAYNRQIGLIGLVNAYNHGCHSRYEAAEYLEVTEEFLQDAIDCYHSKYGVCVDMDNYVIFFEPTLAVMEKSEIIGISL